MLRFIDLSHEYWTDYTCGSPICAFLDTSTDTFRQNGEGAQTFFSMEEIEEHPDAERMKRLMPARFFDRHIPRNPEEVLAEIGKELYGKGLLVSGWHLNGDLEPLDSWFEDNEGWL